MGKSYRKHVKEERSKVKLKKVKSTKTILPKGQNLTDVNFKVKKVVIKDQIKIHDSNELLFRNKLNLKELITRLGHHNASMKNDAVEGLKQLISASSIENIEMEFSTLFEGIIKLILCETSEIRKSSNKLLSMLFSKMGTKKFTPLFHLLNSYLICGLTHIDRNVREDSLHFLDTCLKLVPELCANHAVQLISVCLDLVSEKSDQSRTLSLNLEVRKGSMKWRSQVLNRIETLFFTLLHYHKDYNKVGHPKENESIFREEHYNSEGGNCFPIYNQAIFYSTTEELGIFKTSLIGLETENSFPKDLATSILPLLLQIFIEICPQNDLLKSNQEPFTIISEEDAQLLKTIVNIIDLMWAVCERGEDSNLKNKELSDRYGKSIINTFIKGRFPYYFATTQGEKIMNQSFPNRHLNPCSKNMETSCFSQNLGLAKLVFLYCNESQWELVIPYLKKIFRLNNNLTQTDSTNLICCLENICKKNDFEETNYFLKKIVSKVKKSEGALAPHCFKLLCDFALDQKLKHIHQNEVFKSWLETLPHKLTKERISSSHIDIICKLAPRNFPSFTQSLDGLIEVILDNLPNLEIIGQNNLNVQKQIANLLFWVKDWDDELEESLMVAINNKYWGIVLSKYIEDIITMRKERFLETESFEESVEED